MNVTIYCSCLLLLCYLYIGQQATTQCTFPKGFRFGTATSSYQIEGGWNASGKSKSIWDYGTHKYPERIQDRSNGDIACDSYNQIDTDVENLKFLHVSFYRFSINWPRLLPNGDASFINPDGVRYYNELINKLIANNIEPMITIFHWELPQILQEIGGWTNPDIIEYFQQFARTCYRLFGDRVKKWLTVNEISVYCTYGYDSYMPPNVNSPGIGTYICAHNMLLAHGYAYRIYKKQFYSQKGEVGLAIESPWYYPSTNSTADKDAVKRAHATSLGWLADPVFSKKGDYSALLQQLIRTASIQEGRLISRLPCFTGAEIKMLKGSADFFGLNHYTSVLVESLKTPILSSSPSAATDKQILFSYDPKWGTTSRDFFRVVPDGMRKILNYIKNQYNNPKVYITENGFAGFADEGFDDERRIDYNNGYLTAVSKAINEDGCNVKGYTAWAFMDNFEWVNGYTIRFGIFFVDFNDPQRTRKAKKSAVVYKQIIASGMVDQCYKYDNMEGEGTRDHNTGRAPRVVWLKEKIGPIANQNIWHIKKLKDV